MSIRIKHIFFALTVLSGGISCRAWGVPAAGSVLCVGVKGLVFTGYSWGAGIGSYFGKASKAIEFLLEPRASHAVSLSASDLSQHHNDIFDAVVESHPLLQGADAPDSAASDDTSRVGEHEFIRDVVE